MKIISDKTSSSFRTVIVSEKSDKKVQEYFLSKYPGKRINILKGKNDRFQVIIKD